MSARSLLIPSLVLLSLTLLIDSAAGQAAAKPAEAPLVELETSMGKIVIELDAEKAPKTVENFLQYVKDDHYKDTVFHRVIPDFMIQGGGMTVELKEKKTRPPVVNEAGNGLSNKKYTVAMARKPDPNSATSQFFINVSDKNSYLDRNAAEGQAGYTVFGKVVKGMDVVDQISKVKTKTVAAELLMRDVPVKPVFLKNAKILE